MHSLCLVIGIACLVAVTICQSTTVCNPVTGICFEQLFNPSLNVTVGLALPPKEDSEFVNEALILGVSRTFRFTSFPLPYGFAGVLLGHQNSVVEQAPVVGVMWYEDFVSEAQEESTPFSIDDCRAEIAASGSNNSLIPLLHAPLTATFSPLTTWGTTAARFIFRCPNCSILTDYLTATGETTLTTVISTSYPMYIDDTLTLANLSLLGAQYEEFTFNTTAAYFSNYSAFLSAAGLV
ncbi:hypothetical protein B0H11DRAFT_2242319 [Mycena galericulata]|nr:hypothetical protein B0H11DRAFT_2242319 [Mycena galericulata]